MALPESLSVLRHRDFRVYWIGQSVSLVGTWMQVMAQNWVVTAMSPRASVLGLLVLAGSLPMLLLGLKAGALADRLDRRRILIVTQVAMMALAFAFAGLVWSGRLALWHVFGLAAMLGTAAAFDLPAAQALAPELVEKKQIPRAVALMSAIFHGGRLVGPALAGVLIQQWGEASAFAANGVSFLAVIVSLLLLRPRPPAPAVAPAAQGATGGPPRGGAREGIAYLRRDVTSRGLLVLTGLTMGLPFPFLAVLMAYYAKHVLGADASGMGNIMSASGFGAMAGAITLVVASAASWRNRLWVGVALLSGCSIALAYNGSIPLAVAITAVLSYGVAMLIGTIMQTVQARVPGELRGRVMSLFGMAFTSVMPFASLGLSALADEVGYRRLMAACAALYAVAAAVVLVQLGRALAGGGAAAGTPEPGPAAASPANLGQTE